ncbi:MAG: TetR/AcrR family transcriptional regulator [Pseudomonadota bacterium]|nr:TetR/AcrR family transcriptional regulator [Pseudomonadota bacterium]
MTAKLLKKKPRPGPGRLTAEAAAELPGRLLDAAFELFTERGYAGTTMEQIARRAGASTKTIYARYSGKEDILQAVVRRIVERTVAAHGEAVTLDPSGVDPRRYLKELCAQIATRIATEAAGLNRLALAEGHMVPALKRLHAEAVARGTALIRAALEQWRDEGLLPRLDQPERAAALCLSMTTDPTRIRTSLGAPPSRKEIEAHVDYAVDLFLRGCGYDPHKA